MKVAVFSDLHAHIYKEFDAKSDLTGSERLDLIIQSLDYMKDYCIENDISTILFAGDAFHIRSRVSTVVFNAVYDKFKDIAIEGIDILAIPGNHDDTDNSDLPKHSLHAFKDIDGVTIVDTLTTEYLSDGTPVVCVRYSKNASMIKDFIERVDNTGEKTPILLGHLGVNGGFVGKGNYPMADAFEVEDLRPDAFRYVLLGHYHRRQNLGEHSHVMYVGAPIQHSFSDEGEDKGFVVVDTSSHHVEFVPIPNPKFVTYDDKMVQIVDFHEHVENGDYIRIQAREEHLDSTLSFLPEGLKYKLELTKDYVETTRVDVKIGMSDEEVVKKYAKEFKPESEDLGLKILANVKGG